MRRYSGEHWSLIAAFLGLAGVQIAGLSSWQEALTPLFVGTFLGQLAILIRAFHSQVPKGGSNGGRTHP